MPGQLVQSDHRIYGDKFLNNIYSFGDYMTHDLYSIESSQNQTTFSSNFINQIDKLSKSYWQKKQDDSFTQEELLNNEDDQVQDLIFLIRKSFFISCHEILANKLITLFNYAKEEDSTSVGISLGSLRNFYNFFQTNTRLKCPIISLSPDNNIYASWSGEQNRKFSVYFLPNNEANFAIFKPNDMHPNQQIRLSGMATTDILMKTVEPYTVSDWISE